MGDLRMSGLPCLLDFQRYGSKGSMGDEAAATSAAVIVSKRMCETQLQQQTEQGVGMQWWDAHCAYEDDPMPSLHHNVLLVLLQLATLSSTDAKSAVDIFKVMMVITAAVERSCGGAAAELPMFLAKPVLHQLAPAVLHKAQARQQPQESAAGEHAVSSCRVLSAWAALQYYFLRQDTLAGTRHMQHALLQKPEVITAVEASLRAFAAEQQHTPGLSNSNRQPWPILAPLITLLSPLAVPALAQNPAAAATATSMLAPAGSSSCQAQVCSVLFSALKIIGSSNSHIAGRDGADINTQKYWRPYVTVGGMCKLADEAVHGLLQPAAATGAGAAKRMATLRKLFCGTASASDANAATANSAAMAAARDARQEGHSNELAAWLAVVARSVWVIGRALEKATKQQGLAAASSETAYVQGHVAVLVALLQGATEASRLLLQAVPSVAAAAAPGAPDAVAAAMQQLQQHGEQLIADLQAAAADEAAQCGDKDGWVCSIKASLPQQLQQFAAAASSELVPLHCCCANPACEVLSGFREVDLVAGSSTVCSGCKAVRYCCSECQLQHWKAAGGHRKVCKRLKSAATGGENENDANESRFV